jgi:hypothetical protein
MGRYTYAQPNKVWWRFRCVSTHSTGNRAKDNDLFVIHHHASLPSTYVVSYGHAMRIVRT